MTEPCRRKRPSPVLCCQGQFVFPLRHPSNIFWCFLLYSPGLIPDLQMN
jgi:hypothetical protein